MKKLNRILQSKFFYLFLICSSLIYSFLNFNIPKKSKIDINNNYFEGIITNIKVNGDLLTIEIKNNEKIIGNYYFSSEQEKFNFISNYHLGDRISINGSFSIPNNNTIPNLFNYRRYLRTKGINYIVKISNLKKIANNKKLFYKIINCIEKRIETYKSKSYLQAFILGKTDLLDYNIKANYQELGVSHLLAISGMHISLFSGIIVWILKKLHINKIISYFLTTFFLLFYMKLTGNTSSVSRAVTLFILLTINKIFKTNLSTLKIWCLTFCIIVFKNPYSLLDIGFQFSFIVSFYLILLQKHLNSNNYFLGLIKVSIISSLVSLPISIYYFYQINILSVLWNLIFVPLISLIIFPLSLVSFIIPFLDSILYILINIMEKIAFFCGNYKMFEIIFGRPSFIWIFIYYLFITLFLYKEWKPGIIVIIILLLFKYFNLIIIPNTFIVLIDVGQGDSILIHSNNNTVLIDTGGKMNYHTDSWRERKTKNLSDTTIIPLLKSYGIKKINYLILSHGDYDHAGEAINIINKFKIDNVIFNSDTYNDLEKRIIEKLKIRKVRYYKDTEKLKFGNNKLYFLNTKVYDNENDNSNVIYYKFNGFKFLFMGDAGIKRENDILNKYNIKDIDVLKVGHHGSKTSSSKIFIDNVKPKYSLISVGKNNRYSHPNQEVLDNLKNTKIFRTDIDGSILINIHKNSFKIKNYAPQ